MKHGLFRHMVGILLILLPLVAAGCGGGGGSAPAGTTVTPNAVTGKITLNGTGLSQVSLSINGGSPAFSDVNGNYGFTHLANGTYTVTPTLAGYTFSPASASVTIDNNGAVADFTAVPIPTFSISGKVSSANAGIAGATVNVSTGGNLVATKVSDGSGNFSATGLVAGTYAVTVSHPTVQTFTVASRNVTITDANATADFSAPGVHSYAISGRVATSTATGLANVSLTLTIPGTPAVYHTTTDASGNYSFGGIVEEYYKLTPLLSGYFFQPDPLLLSLSGADLTGQDILGATQPSGGGSVNVSL